MRAPHGGRVWRRSSLLIPQLTFSPSSPQPNLNGIHGLEALVLRDFRYVFQLLSPTVLVHVTGTEGGREEVWFLFVCQLHVFCYDLINEKESSKISYPWVLQK